MSELRSADSGPSHSPRARRQVFNSLSTRIIFFVFLSTFLSALVVSWISIHAIQTQLMTDLDRRFPTLLDGRLEAVEAIASRLEAQVAIAANDPAIVQAIESKRDRTEILSTNLDELFLARPAFDGLLLIDPKGNPLAGVGDVGDAARHAAIEIIEDESTGLDGGSSSVGGGEAGPVRLLFVQPVGNADPPIAWLVARHDIAPIVEALGLGRDTDSARISLVDAHGLVIASSHASPRGQLTERQLERMADGRVHDYSTHDRTHVLGATRALTRGRWNLLIEAPFEDAFSPVLSVVSRIFVSDLVIILVFSFLAYKITAAVMHPIRALSDGARRISRGDYDHEIPDARGNDEIGLLIRTFNDMVAQLRRNATEIEDDQQRLTEQNEELQRANEVLAQLSITDGLTKLHNHRYFQDHLTREIKRIGRTGEALSMILMDLDDFKKLNDLYGHSAGDELLVGVANILIDSVRESDLLARYGGEEFVILAPGTSLEGAVSMAEKIRMGVEGSSHIVDDSMRPIRVTISIGVAVYDGDRRTFFQAADRALYDAKAQGKNCVIAAEADEEL